MTEANQSAEGTTGEGQEQAEETQEQSVLSQGIDTGEQSSEEGEQKEQTGEQEDKEEKAEEPKWKAQLPDNLKGDKRFDQYKTIGELAEKLIELEGSAEGAFKLPGEDATEEEVAAYREVMGIPESHEQYDVENITVPDGLPIDTETVLKYAHENNISQSQLEGFATSFFDHVEEGFQREADEFDGVKGEVSANLTEAWGPNFDANMAKVRTMSNLFANLLVDEGVFKSLNHVEKYMNDTNTGNDIAVIRGFKALYDLIGEDSIGALRGSSDSQGLKRDQFGRGRPDLSVSFPDE